MSLFSALYAYRPRIREGDKQHREPLEDWLTECLAACIRATLVAGIDTASEVLATLSESPSASVAKALRQYELRIETQVVAGSEGRPDMVFRLGDWPWIIVENKVNHVATFEQLAKYERWQLQNAGKTGPVAGLRPTLLFVTQNTLPPEQIRNGSQPFNSVRSVTNKWSRISKVLCAVTKALSPDSHARALADGFREFLEEKHMANEYPSTSAIAAAELFLQNGGDVISLADEMLFRAEALGNFFKMTTYAARPFPAEGLIYASRWANTIIGDHGGMVYTGLFFPAIGSYRGDLQERLGIEISDFAKVFVSIEGQGLMAQKDDAPTGWLRDAEEFVIFKDFAAFEGSSDERGLEILKWTETVCSEFRAWADK